MSRFRGIKGRLGRVEAANDAGLPVPSVLRVAFGETQAEATTRYAKQWPNRPHNCSPLVVPAKPRTEAERKALAERFKASQTKLVAEARSNRISTVAAKSAPQAAPRQWNTSPVIRPNGPHVIWRPNA